MSKKKLYRGSGTKARMKRSFARRYGARGAYVYGAVIGKVAREQARKRGRKVERIRGHPSHSRSGTPEEVRPHEAILVGSRYPPEGSYSEMVRGYEVPGHASRSRKGKREWVRRHRVRAHPTTVRRI